MPRTKGLRAGLIAGLGGVTVLAGVSLAMPLTGPTTWGFDQPRLAAVSEARAVAAASAAPADLEEAAVQTQRTLAEKPLNASAWARLAWIADQKGDRVAMLDALDRSFAAAPYGPDITAWRLRFAFDRWSDLTPELRRQARSELTVAARVRPGLVAEVQPSVSDPSGRMAWALTKPQARDS